MERVLRAQQKRGEWAGRAHHEPALERRGDGNVGLEAEVDLATLVEDALDDQGGHAQRASHIAACLQCNHNAQSTSKCASPHVC